MSDPLVEKLLKNNKEWAEVVTKADPEFFARSAKEKQRPQALWIGCSDSRVPASLVTGSKPGDLFVHRNIANQVPPKDDNVLSVVDYAVAHLEVKHVIVVGHTECGGAKHCLEAAQNPHPSPPNTPLLRWLEPLTELARSLNFGLLPPEVALLTLVEENVRRQVQHLAETETIKHAWGKGDNVWIHGLVYDLSTGHLSDLHVTKKRPGK